MDKFATELDAAALKDFLDEKAAFYENPVFIETDPIQIPHQFSKKQDIEIAALLTALIAWGNRSSILKSAQKIMTLMDGDPYGFVSQHSPKDLKVFEGFVHRTFQTVDLQFILQALQSAYQQEDSLEAYFIDPTGTHDYMAPNISRFREFLLRTPHQKRSEKHLANPLQGSAAKRLHMYLRWMVRPAKKGVDFNLWKKIPPAKLSCPLDVHSGNVARKLGLLDRKQNDAKAVEQLDQQLRRLDPIDPVKYDFALFGLGVFEKF
ncbi:MAG: TIGR02757 family protein [Flavobacteriaceae bacterium]